MIAETMFPPMTHRGYSWIRIGVSWDLQQSLKSTGEPYLGQRRCMSCVEYHSFRTEAVIVEEERNDYVISR